MPKEHVDYLLWIAQNAPSKQHEAYYDIHYSTDRKVIEELYKWSWGYTHSGKPPAAWRNPQMNANLFMLFVMKHPPTSRNNLNNGSVTPTDHPARWENGLVAVGTALGLVMRAAVELGYATGCNKNNSQGPDCDFNWERRMGLYEDIHIHKKSIRICICFSYVCHFPIHHNGGGLRPPPQRWPAHLCGIHYG